MNLLTASGAVLVYGRPRGERLRTPAQGAPVGGLRGSAAGGGSRTVARDAPLCPPFIQSQLSHGLNQIFATVGPAPP